MTAPAMLALDLKYTIADSVLSPSVTLSLLRFFTKDLVIDPLGLDSGCSLQYLLT